MALACFDEPYISFPATMTVVKVLQPLQEMGRLCVQIAKQRIADRALSLARSERRSPQQIQLSPILQAVGRHTGGTVREFRVEQGKTG